MKKYLILLPIIAAAVVLSAMSSGMVFGKAHVPASQVQVSHKGRTAINVDAPALKAHVGHGDIQLPACDFANVFPPGADTSNVLAAGFSGVTYSGTPSFIARVDAGGATGACPPGVF